MALIQFFDRPCCGPSPAIALKDFLATRANDAEVEYHNLNDTGTQAVTVPASLIAHLTGGGALPVMVVDGTIVATGTLPNLMDALDLAQGRTPAAARTLLQVTTTANGNGCC
jgi:antitoxin component of MazEF toxin-antitoxin module